MKKKKMKKINSWHFLLTTILAYGIIFILSPRIFFSGLRFFIKIFLKIIPVLAIVFVLLVIVNRYIDKKFILKYLQNKNLKSWLFFILGGIISTGPIYMWYPLLKNLKEKGVTNGEIACFLYNRAIKPALLPIIILYFGLKYVITLTFVMIFLSLVQAFLIEKILPSKKFNKNYNGQKYAA